MSFEILSWIIYYVPIMIIVLAALWRQGKLGIEYQLVLSTVVGIITGIWMRPPEALLGIYVIAIGLIVVSLIMMFILFIVWISSELAKSKGNSRDDKSKIINVHTKYYTRIILSLFIFLLISSLTSVFSTAILG